MSMFSVRTGRGPPPYFKLPGAGLGAQLPLERIEDGGHAGVVTYAVWLGPHANMLMPWTVLMFVLEISLDHAEGGWYGLILVWFSILLL